MNKVFILEEMGFEVTVDFTVDDDGVITWLTIDPQPSETDIQTAWDNHVVGVPAKKLTDARDRALKIIDNLAETKRLEYISPGAGQALVYEAKAKQAQEFKDGGYVNPENYPFIDKESTVKGITAQALADIILANQALWIGIGSDIEGERLVSKETIRNAVDEDEMGNEIVRFEGVLAGI